MEIVKSINEIIAQNNRKKSIIVYAFHLFNNKN